MQILLVGDSHGNWPFMEQALSLATDTYPLVIQVGDFGSWPGSDWLEDVRDIAARSRLGLWFIDGNHDWPDGYRRYSTTTPEVTGFAHVPRGTTVEIDGCRIGFFGGAVSVDQHRRREGKSWWADEMVTEADVDLVQPCDVWVTHDSVELPPDRQPFDFGHKVNFEIAIQRDRMRRALDVAKPKLHVHGHWHHRYSADSPYGRTIGLSYENNDALWVLDTDRWKD